ncbi:proline iminopeptidase-family hydrolase [Sphingomonas kyeonggiensis]|uniref:Proline iminopeptidase/L-proline amide hydrolase n=1 Tax=Sphingomonas kyeonggiensis TaxID=1268553 RepID=A0A7W6NVP4_9SPHN|nr:proline iminopeptidase-family hydrolase [Sphingomonas kyeonggiensis]MBB4096831.1 proline iminopeptidase/L-proline amide hydrolase [Sphingomonas kyeonggiensis]
MTPIGRRAFLGGLAAGAIALPAWARIAGRDIRFAPDKELMVPVEGGSVYVRVNGDLKGKLPPLIYAHGGPGGDHSGLLPLTALAQERAVILWDQLDSGRSDAPLDPKNWHVSRFVDEIDRIRNALGITRWHVGGGSWGGTLAIEYGARRRPDTASLIVQSPLVSTKSWLADANLLRSQMPAEARTTLEKCDTAAPPPEATCEAATWDFYRRHVIRSQRADGVAEYRARAPRDAGDTLYNRMWGKAEFVSTGTLKDYDGEPLLAKLDGPKALFVCGEYDEARPETVAKFAARVPGATFREVMGSAHSILSDQPDAYLALLRDWMARHDAA